METQKKFEVGQFWKDSDGDKHLICDISSKYIYTFCFFDRAKYVFNLDGILFDDNDGGDLITLIEPWEEPRSGEVWVNVYSAGFPYPDFEVHKSKFNSDASACATSNQFKTLLARIKMPWKEGQFDE